MKKYRNLKIQSYSLLVSTVLLGMFLLSGCEQIDTQDISLQEISDGVTDKITSALEDTAKDVAQEMMEKLAVTAAKDVAGDLSETVSDMMETEASTALLGEVNEFFYSNSAFNFEITLPSDGQMFDQAAAGDLFLLLVHWENAEKEQSIFLYANKKNLGEISDDELAEEMTKIMEDKKKILTYTNSEIPGDIETRTIGGITVASFRVTSSDTEVPIEEFSCFYENGYIIYMELAGPEENFDELENSIETLQLIQKD